jgi:hypothetical protein
VGVLELSRSPSARRAEVLSMKGAKIGLLLVISRFRLDGRDGLAHPQPFRPRGLGWFTAAIFHGPSFTFRRAADGGRRRERPVEVENAFAP